MSTNHVDEMLERFDVDPIRGFLPTADPLARMPRRWSSWDRLGTDLPGLIAVGGARSAIERLPDLDTDDIRDESELRRAMLLLSVFGNTYVFCEAAPALQLPAGLCRAWNDIATRLERPMIIAHASIVLHNWRRLDPAGPIVAENLRTLQCFRGGPDEEWFYLLTAEIEATGATAIPSLVKLRLAIEQGRADELHECLEIISQTIHSMTEVLERMEERCRHAVFYRRIRPFLSGWPDPGVIYEGIDRQPRVLHGGSAAQSSLLNAFDAALSVPHEHPRTRPFLQAMRHYMPPRHRRFLEWLESGPALRESIADDHALSNRYDLCIDALVRFRRTHQQITMRYITGQAPDRDRAIGTGGTEYADFLRRTRDETSDRRLN